MFLAQCRWWWTVFGISVIVIIPKTFFKVVILRFPCIVAFGISAPFDKVLRFFTVYTTANNSFSIVNRIIIVGGTLWRWVPWSLLRRWDDYKKEKLQGHEIQAMENCPLGGHRHEDIVHWP